MNLNMKKFQMFLDLARELNQKFNVVPVLWGPLGLCSALGVKAINGVEASQIDILVPSSLMQGQDLASLMESLGFNLSSEDERKFINERGEIVCFGPDESLSLLPNSALSSLWAGQNVRGIKYQGLTVFDYRCLAEAFAAGRDDSIPELKKSLDWLEVYSVKFKPYGF